MADSTPSGEEKPPSVQTSPRFLTRLRLEFWIAGIWLAFLLFLTVTSANPITVNRAQVRDADLVVLAEVLEPDPGRCRLQKTLRGPAPEEFFQVKGLNKTNVSRGRQYLLPLNIEPDVRYSITPSPDGTPLVYLFTPEAMRQYHDIEND